MFKSMTEDDLHRFGEDVDLEFAKYISKDTASKRLDRNVSESITVSRD